MSDQARKTKTRWLTEEWLARRDEFVASIVPDKEYRLRDAALALARRYSRGAQDDE